MRNVMLLLFALAWIAATGFIVWMLYTSGHPVVAGFFAVFGAVVLYPATETRKP